VWALGCVLGLAAAGWLAAGVRADAKKDADATGTWKSSRTMNGQTFETVYKLKQDGDKLTGTVTGPDKTAVKIDKGEVKDGKVTFYVNRERNGQKFSLKFHGKLEGDNIKGKIEFSSGGQSRSFPWQAKRQK
jgi:hypothetical protein